MLLSNIRWLANGEHLTDIHKRAKLASFEHEVFYVLLLDSQNRLIADVEILGKTIA